MLASTGNLVAIVEMYRGARHFDNLAGHLEWMPGSKTRFRGHMRMSLAAVKAGTYWRVCRRPALSLIPGVRCRDSSGAGILPGSGLGTDAETGHHSPDPATLASGLE
jgi:hypothetical protein